MSIVNPPIRYVIVSFSQSNIDPFTINISFFIWPCAITSTNVPRMPIAHKSLPLVTGSVCKSTEKSAIFHQERRRRAPCLKIQLIYIPVLPDPVSRLYFLPVPVANAKLIFTLFHTIPYVPVVPVLPY
jgi:hypothetical protein